jgi:hypothetical protein
MTTEMSTSPLSLLSPPNPALQPQQPPGSILINRNDPSCLPPDQLANVLANSSNVSRVTSAIKQSFSIKDTVASGNSRQPGPPAAVFNRRNRASSMASTVSSTSSAGSSSQSGGLHRSSSVRSPNVSFAPLPHVPELERRSSITLGVAARSNLLKTQGASAGPRTAGGPIRSGQPDRQKKGGSQVLMMTDEEWEEYKRNIQARNAAYVVYPP